MLSFFGTLRIVSVSNIVFGVEIGFRDIDGIWCSTFIGLICVFFIQNNKVHILNGVKIEGQLYTYTGS
jgi:hypothetical protein